MCNEVEQPLLELFFTFVTNDGRNVFNRARFGAKILCGAAKTSGAKKGSKRTAQTSDRTNCTSHLKSCAALREFYDFGAKLAKVDRVVNGQTICLMVLNRPSIDLGHKAYQA